jgi:hypothetical protein
MQGNQTHPTNKALAWRIVLPDILSETLCSHDSEKKRQLIAELPRGDIARQITFSEYHSECSKYTTPGDPVSFPPTAAARAPWPLNNDWLLRILGKTPSLQTKTPELGTNDEFLAPIRQGSLFCVPGQIDKD